MNNSTGKLGVVLAAIAAVVAWKIAALLLLRADPEQESLIMPALLSLAGVAYLACGLWVFLKLPGRASSLFMGFCICTGLHWGGPLELESGDLRTGLILLYVWVSGILGATLLLHLAMTFPKASRLAERRAVVGLLYGPVALAAVLAAITQEGFLLVHMIVSNLFSLLALTLFASWLFRSGLNTIQKRYVGLMVVGMLVAWLPYIVASAAGVEDTDAWNLTVVVLPVSFAVAFFGIGATESGRGRQRSDSAFAPPA